MSGLGGSPMKTVHAFAALECGLTLEPFSYDLGEIGSDQVDIRVETCGICHSDLSMLQNHWGNTVYPIVPGHEVIGIIEEVGRHVKELKVGQRVGLGWFSGSCMHCKTCMSGDHNMCDSAEQTIVGRHGGFSDRVRCNSEWAIPLPETLDSKSSGPLFCGGITVFNPIVQFNVQPTDRVGVIGIGGLGHLALQFLNHWGCEVTAFTSTSEKGDEALRMGAHHVVSSTEVKESRQQFDFILNTTNVPLNWDAYLNLLGPKGRLHTVGAVLEPLPIPAFSLISKQRSVSGSPLGSPATIDSMLEFCARHSIAPITEVFPMDKVNDAIDHLYSGNARYRVVLENKSS